MLDLTRQERGIILFLITVALVGLGINFLIKTNSKVASYVIKDFGRINLNQADIFSLTSIPGIGEKTAKAIIEYRNRNAGFTDIEELMHIKGIGESKYNNIKDYIVIE